MPPYSYKISVYIDIDIDIDIDMDIDIGTDVDMDKYRNTSIRMYIKICRQLVVYIVRSKSLCRYVHTYLEFVLLA